MNESLNFVVVGHIDHGKSTLIGRLLFDTGFLPRQILDELSVPAGKMELAHLLDQLKEERERGITIDTTQTFFRTRKRNYVIIDAPGHKQFLKNMITGASQAEAAVLIVAADEGLREQTLRHAYLLRMLGLEQVLVLVNKMDISGYSQSLFESVSGQIRDFLRKLDVEPTHIVPISALQGDNVAKRSERMRWYEGPTALEALDEFNVLPPASGRPLRFSVQDVYDLDSKRILVGRVETGRLSQGERIRFFPSGQDATIASIEVFGKNPSSAEAGMSIGVRLAEPLGIERGEIACPQESPPVVTERFRGNIFWMADRPFEIEEEIILRCATQEAPCRVAAIEKRINSATLELLEENAERLLPAEVGEVVIETEKPLVIETFYDVKELGRFILLRNQENSAGGIVTHSRDTRLKSEDLMRSEDQ